MIIPVRCFTCGKVIGDKWEDYVELLSANMSEKRVGREGGTRPAVAACDRRRARPFTRISRSKPDLFRHRRDALDALGLERYCCRRMASGNVGTGPRRRRPRGPPRPPDRPHRTLPPSHPLGLPPCHPAIHPQVMTHVDLIERLLDYSTSRAPEGEARR